MLTLSCLVVQMGTGFNIFVPMIAKVGLKHNVQHAVFEGLVARVMKGLVPIPEGGEDPTVANAAKTESSVDDQAPAAIS